MVDDDALQVTRLREKLAEVGAGGNYREPLMAAIGFYITASKRRCLTPDFDHLKAIIREEAGGALYAHGRGHYLIDRHLNDLIEWYDRHIIVSPAVSKLGDAEKAYLNIKARHKSLMKAANDYDLISILKGGRNHVL